jgi:hypothetical protein
VSSSHKNGHCGRGSAKGPIVSLQSNGPVPYRYDMVSDISNTFAGGRENNASTWIFRLGWISSTCGQTLDASRFKGFTYSIVNAYFDALTDLFLENSYPSDAISNVDETGFALGTTLPSKVLIREGDTTAFKKISGRQEWITVIECIGASGAALPPLLIFKARFTNTVWIPASTPKNWKFSTSNSGWTSNNPAYEWLTTLSEPDHYPLDSPNAYSQPPGNHAAYYDSERPKSLPTS